MKKLFTLMLFLSSFFAVSLFAWTGNSYLVVNGTWYTGSNEYVQPAGKFHDANLGSFATSFTLNGEVQVYPKSSTAATLYYRIDNDDNNIKTLSLPKVGDEGNNSKHSASTPATIDVSGLSAGVHYIDCWFNHGSDYDNNGGSNFKASFTVVKAPVVTLLVPDFVYIDETITLDATPENVDDPVITYSVKVPESSEFVVTTSPYEPTATGTYTFKAEVKAGGVGDVLAFDTKDVIVKAVPDDIVIKVHKSVDWENLYIFVWNTADDGHKLMSQDPSGWYVHTFTREEEVNFLFVNVDDFGAPGKVQTDDVKNVTTSNCYEIYEEGENVIVTPTDCNKIITAVSKITDQVGVQIRTDNQTISVDLETAASISLYAVSGQLLSQHRASTHFVHSVKSGVYILQIDGKSHKLIVK